MREERCYRAGLKGHLDPCNEMFIHCCPEATRAAHDWLTYHETFTPEEGFRLHARKIGRLLGVR